MKLSVTTTSPDIKKLIPVALLTGDFVTRMRKASQLGYDGVELIVNNPDKVNSEYILSTISDLGLEIAAISTGGLSSLEHLTLMSHSYEVMSLAFARLEKLITFAHKVNAPILTIGSFRGSCLDTSPSMDCSNLKGVLQVCSDLALKLNVRLVIEPLNRYESNFLNKVEETLNFINDVGSPGIGVLIDTYHANIEESSMTECFRLANDAQRLWHIHLGDSNRFAPGFGHIDFPSIFTFLAELQYDGFLSAELLPHPDPDKAAIHTVEYCRPFII